MELLGCQLFFTPETVLVSKIARSYWAVSSDFTPEGSVCAKLANGVPMFLSALIKPDIQRLVRQALRSVGSGCATQTDVDFVWQDVQSMVIRDMITKDNLRPDGRGLIDSRPASYQVTILSTPPLFSNVFCPAYYVPTFVEI